MVFRKVCTNLRKRESDQPKTVLELFDLEIQSEDIEARLSNFENDSEEKHRSETLITKLLTPEMGGSKQGQRLRTERSRAAGDQAVLKDDQKNAINGKQKDSVREEIVAVSGTMRISVQKSTPKSAPPSAPPTHKDGRNTQRRKSQRLESIWEVRSTAVRKLFEKYLH